MIIVTLTSYTGPLSLAASQNKTITFALLAGNSLADLIDAAARAVSTLTDVESDEDDLLPEQFILHQNFPNPFNPETHILFDLPRSSEYTLSIFNLLGEKVYEKTAAAKAGRVEVIWNAEEFASGVYFYRVTVGNDVASRKMLLLK